MSYFDVYFNLRGERTLRNFSQPVNLARFDRLNWMTSEKSVWFIAEHLCHIAHTPLLKPWMIKNLQRLDRRSFDDPHQTAEANARTAAASVAAMSSPECAAETKPASYADGAR